MAVKYPVEIERGWGFLLKDVNRLHVKRFEQRARLHGLTLPECRVLIYLSHEEGLTQVRLAALTDIEPMTLVRMLDRMEADGWLERRSSPSDRRARHIHAKPKGRALMDEIAQLEVQQGVEINEAKKRLASEATALLHGREAADRAAETATTAMTPISL